MAQFLALAAWNAPDSGTPEGRRRQLEYLDSGIAAARPDVQLDRLLLVSAHAQRGAVQAQARCGRGQGGDGAPLASAAKHETVHVLRRHVQETLSENGCLPTEVVDRLAQERIRPGE